MTRNPARIAPSVANAVMPTDWNGWHSCARLIGYVMQSLAEFRSESDFETLKPAAVMVESFLRDGIGSDPHTDDPWLVVLLAKQALSAARLRYAETYEWSLTYAETDALQRMVRLYTTQLFGSSPDQVLAAAARAPRALVPAWATALLRDAKAA